MLFTGKLIKQITKGDWDVTDYYGVDEKNGMVYFQSAELSAIDRQVYAIKLNGTAKKRLSTKKGQNSAEFTSSFKYFINYHSSVTSPKYITLNNSKGKAKRVLEDNEALNKRLEGFNLSYKEFFKIKVNEVALNAWKILPQNFDETKNIQC